MRHGDEYSAIELILARQRKEAAQKKAEDRDVLIKDLDDFAVRIENHDYYCEYLKLVERVKELLLRE